MQKCTLQCTYVVKLVFFFSQISVFRFKKKSTKRIFTFYISVSFIFLFEITFSFYEKKHI